jgi:hypothetical protein
MLGAKLSLERVGALTVPGQGLRSVSLVGLIARISKKIHAQTHQVVIVRAWGQRTNFRECVVRKPMMVAITNNIPLR